MARIINIIKLLKRFFRKKPSTSSGNAVQSKATRIPAKKHALQRHAINPNAIKVLEKLHQAGYTACLVGGCVRDLLLNRHPKDFDIATNARPEEVRRLFRNCRLIGRRFRLAHILFGAEIIEVATFRTHHENATEEHARSRNGMIIRDNVYGSIEDDIWRRDFSINALYYNIADESIIDFAGGIQDIRAKRLHIIGDPEKRFTEDPVRLLRAVRFMGKLNLSISKETEIPLSRLSHLLRQVSPARLYQEVLKLFQEGALAKTFQLLEKYCLFETLFYETATHLHEPETRKLLDLTLTDTDQRIATGKTVSPAFLFAVLLWRPIHQHAKNAEEDTPPYLALEKAISHVLSAQTKQLAIPRKLTSSVREIIVLQYHLNQRRGSRPWRSLEHPRFRAACDLLVLRAAAGEPISDLANWWTNFASGDKILRETLIREAASATKRTTSPKGKKRRPRHYARPRKPRNPNNE